MAFTGRGHPDDYTLSQLNAFRLHPPQNSASFRKSMGLDYDISTILQALLVDSIRMIGRGLGGKTLSKKDRVAPLFLEKKEREKLKERMANAAKEKQNDRQARRGGDTDTSNDRTDSDRPPSSHPRRRRRAGPVSDIYS